MIYHFILNPKSGRPKSQRNIEDVIKAACRARQLQYHLYYTTCPGDATEYVRSMIRISKERQRFTCIGGDGTLNEIVNSAPSNPNIEFGVIPYGSGNDFVRNFSRKELFRSIDAQIDGTPFSLDLIKYNDAYSVNMINIGFDCAVAREASKIKKLKLVSPAFSYTLGLIKVFFRKIGTKMTFVFDNGEKLDGVYTLTAIGNGKFCGGGYCVAPEAKMNDGTIDICIIKKVSRFTLLRLISSYKKGTYIHKKSAKKYFEVRKTDHFKMEFDKPVPICIDGEIKGAKTVDFSVVKNAFNFVIPLGSEYIYKD